MKKLFSFAIAIGAFVAVSAQPPAGPANKGMTFGTKVSAKGAVDVNSLSSVVTEEEKTVKIKGK
jgi:hypothetical protein